jgi:hypothetical protein
MIAERLAGCLLYEARGVNDFQQVDPRMQGSAATKPAHRLAWVRAWAYRKMDEILSGQLRLVGLTETDGSSPFVEDNETAHDE